MSQIKVRTEGIVKTSSAEDIVKKIYNGLTWITITGRPGEGKSTFAFSVLKELQRRGRNVFQVTSAAEFSLITRNYSRPIILLNKIFSDVVYGQTEGGNWRDILSVYWDKKKHGPDGQEYDRHSGATVVLVEHDYFLRSVFYYHGKLAEFITQRSHVFDVSKVLKLSEKTNICTAIAERHKISLNPYTVRTICQQEVSAHLVLQLFTVLHKNNPKVSSDVFFKSPQKVFQEEIRTMMQHDLNTSLFKEIVKQDGKVSSDDLKQMDQSSAILQIANDLVGRYLLKENEYFTFLNLSVYNIVEYVICNTFTQFVIKNCELSVIKRRLVLQRSANSHVKQNVEVVHISGKDRFALAQRFALEIDRKNLYLVLSHDACTSDWFVAQMMEQCKLTMVQILDLTDIHSKEAFLSLATTNRSSNLLKYIDQRTKILKSEISVNTILYGACKYAATDVLLYLEKRCELKMNVTRDQDKGRTPVMIAAETKDIEFVKKIMSHNPDLAICDKDGATVLHYLCENGLQSAVEDVINKGATINVTDKFGLSPLHYAAKVDEMGIMKSLLDKGAKPDKKIIDAACRKCETGVVKLLLKRESVNMELACGYTPLHSACAGGNLAIINFLIDNGASVNSGNKSPLHIAASHSEPEVVKSLLHKGAEVKSRDEWDETPFHYAAGAGSKECLELLLDAGESGAAQAEIDGQNSKGLTPLHKATKARSKECVDVLLKAGANVNVETKEGLTPLHLASLKGAEECVQLLIIAGGFVNAVNNTGYTPLHEAAKWGFNYCLDALLKNEADVTLRNEHHQTALHKAAEIGSKACVDLLIDKNAEVNAKTKSGKTPLHFASEGKSQGCVSSLLIATADANIRDDLGFVPLHLAAKAGSQECIELLLDTGINVNVQSNEGETPLHQSAGIASVRCVDLLLQKGANVNEQNKKGETALHKSVALVCDNCSKRFQDSGYKPFAKAVSSKSQSCVVLLMKAEADVNIQNYNGLTPLHLAAEYDLSECLDLLLTHPANVNIQNKKGDTPLHKAVESGSKPCVSSLLKAGADASIENKGGFTPPDIALQRGHTELKDLLEP